MREQYLSLGNIQDVLLNCEPIRAARRTPYTSGQKRDATFDIVQQRWILRLDSFGIEGYEGLHGD